MLQENRNLVNDVETIDDAIRFRNSDSIVLSKFAVADTRRSEIHHDDMWRLSSVISVIARRDLFKSWQMAKEGHSLSIGVFKCT